MTEDLLLELLERGVQIWIDGDQLRCRAPRETISPARQQGLRSRKAALAALLGQRRRHALPSFAQERLWLLDQLEPHHAGYAVSSARRLRGRLEVAVLRRSLAEIVSRHESLRTTFRAIAGRPLQVVALSRTIDLPVVDLSRLPAARREAEARRLAGEEDHRPFALERGPLFRASLLRLAAGDHLLLLTLHHIVTDGWSMAILVRELATLYEAFAAGRPAPLAELPIQYADFARWQRQWLAGEVLEAQLAYWKQQLGGELPVLELPTDRPRPARPSHRGAACVLRVPAGLSASLNELSRNAGTSLYMTLLAAFFAFLYRHTGQKDVLVGAPIANRNREEIEGLIGFFVNILVMRGDLSGSPSFPELLARVRETTLGAYAHQDLPFERLVEELAPVRDPSRHPLFQVTCALHPAPGAEKKLSALSFEPAPVDDTAVRFDLELHLWETPDGSGLDGNWIYSTDLFEAATIARWSRSFHRLLTGIAARPRCRVAELPLLTRPEMHQLVVEWNDQEMGNGGSLTACQLFAAQVARTPEAVAVVFEEKTLSYRELDRRAGHLAHHLRTLGVGPEIRVGLCVERSLAMVVGIVAILKAGGAYVPLETSDPAARRRLIVEDSGIALLLTPSRLPEPRPGALPATVCLDPAGRPVTARPAGPAANPGGRLDPANTAYVIYTSGSTGRPKGVAVTHANLVRLFAATRELFCFGPDDAWTLFHSVAFDFSVWELWGALLHGGRVVVVPFRVSRSPERFCELLARKGVTVVNQTPSAFRMLLPADARLRPRLRLRWVIFGGEALELGSLIPWFERHGDQRPQLVNMYGITETTVHVTFRPLTAADARPSPGMSTGSPIGRPLCDLPSYVVDGRLRPVPLGVPGELCVGGAGLGRGYLDRPALTAERFVPSPFAATAGERLYRTGDRVRLLSRGELEFLGRLDHQVKIRGFRIELGEIETVLGQHPAVRQAVVVARPAAGGEKGLVAYVVASEEHRSRGGSTADQLRTWLRERVPDFMVPFPFVELPALPITPSGKLDRGALARLPLPAPERRDPSRTRGPIEEILAGIWRQVLGLQDIGIRHNFFALGGHSLLAARIISRVRTTFGVELPLRELFEKPTVAELAAVIAAILRAAAGLPAPAVEALTRAPKDGDLPLSYAQQRLWFLDQLEPGSSAYNMPDAMGLEGRLNPTVLEAALREITRRHEILRTAFPSAGGQPRQAIAPKATLRLPLVDLRRLPRRWRRAEALRLANREAARPFDLARGPLIRVALLRLDREQHVLFRNLHHIVSDAWSEDVFYRELTVLYEVFSQGKPSTLPELPMQYGDFALWQRRWLSGAGLEAQLSYWKEQLVGELPALALPTDRPRPVAATYRGAVHPLALPANLSAPLKKLSVEAGASLFMTLLAAFMALLHRMTGQHEIVVGSPIANRDREEFEGLIGLFLNTLALRVDLSGGPASRGPSFSELLGQVREVALGAYAHQDLPFEKLVEALEPDRDLARAPLFQVLFVLLHAPREPTEIAGLTVSPLPLKARTSKFDLTLSLWETQGTFDPPSPGDLLGGLEYCTDLFDRSTIGRLGGHYRTLLSAVVADPCLSIGSLPLLTAGERQQLLWEWNKTSAGSSSLGKARRKTLVAWFEQQAAATPDALAVVFAGQHLTFRQLNAHGNQLAHHLGRHGVDRDAKVGLCVERSLEMVVGVLGILKAGAAYVPLDPAYPRERLAFMVEQTRGPVLLTQEALRDELGELVSGFGTRVVCLDSDWPAIARESTAELAGRCDPRNLAYVIYTSGSTGRPKGIALSHLALTNLIAWHLDGSPAGAGLLAGARTLQYASLSFDASFHEMFATWCSGGTLFLVPEDLRRDVGALARLLSAAAIEKVILPVVVLHRLAEECLAQDVALQLKEISATGEQLHLTPAVVDIFSRFREIVLHNHYGPSETHVVAACRLPPAPHRWPAHPAIGRPIAHTAIYVLDGRMAAVPVGVVGELYVGGASLARGYLHRPTLTAERFLPDPFSDVPDGRLYRTGDLARHLPDGNLEFVGRIDDQVKIRGFRIELGEIEAVLDRHPEIGRAVVVAAKGPGGDQRLVAYVVPSRNTRPQGARREGPTVSELRRFLSERLPEFMIPSVFMTLQALPLTPTGKVDRRALPPPDPTRSVQEGSLQAPRTAIEQTLAAIWSEVLEVERVGVRDDFFALGGHSLMAVRLMARIEERFQVRLPLATLFREATVEGLARFLGEKHPPGRFSPLVAIQPAGSQPPLFLVHPAGGHVLCYADLARHLGQDRPCYGLQTPGRDGRQPFAADVPELAAWYLAAIRNVQAQGPYLLGGWSMGGVVAFEMAQQLRSAGQQVALLALIDSAAPGGGIQGALSPEKTAACLGRIAQAPDLRPDVPGFPWDLLPQLVTEQELIRGLKDAEQAGILPAGIDLARARDLYRLYRSNVRAMMRYSPQPYPGTMTLFRSQEQPAGSDPSLGWSAVAVGEVAVCTVPGDHFTMVREPHVRALAAELNHRLQQHRR